jgi:para-nitrobenzyl esterase
MQAYWTGMAQPGTPGRPAVPSWPAFRAGSQRMISLVPPQPRAGQGFAAAHHCAFWASLASGQ